MADALLVVHAPGLTSFLSALTQHLHGLVVLPAGLGTAGPWAAGRVLPERMRGRLTAVWLRPGSRTT